MSKPLPKLDSIPQEFVQLSLTELVFFCLIIWEEEMKCALVCSPLALSRVCALVDEISGHCLTVRMPDAFRHKSRLSRIVVFLFCRQPKKRFVEVCQMKKFLVHMFIDEQQQAKLNWPRLLCTSQI